MAKSMLSLTSDFHNTLNLQRGTTVQNPPAFLFTQLSAMPFAHCNKYKTWSQKIFKSHLIGYWQGWGWQLLLDEKFGQATVLEDEDRTWGRILHILKVALLHSIPDGDPFLHLLLLPLVLRCLVVYDFETTESKSPPPSPSPPWERKSLGQSSICSDSRPWCNKFGVHIREI
jgi:hypothetical protein